MAKIEVFLWYDDDDVVDADDNHVNTVTRLCFRNTRTKIHVKILKEKISNIQNAVCFFFQANIPVLFGHFLFLEQKKKQIILHFTAYDIMRLNDRYRSICS